MKKSPKSKIEFTVISKAMVMSEPCIPKYFLKKEAIKNPITPAELKIAISFLGNNPINAEIKIIQKMKAMALTSFLRPKPEKRTAPNLSRPKKNKQNGKK